MAQKEVSAMDHEELKEWLRQHYRAPNLEHMLRVIDDHGDQYSGEEFSELEKEDLTRMGFLIGFVPSLLKKMKRGIQAMDIDDRKSEPLRLAEAQIRAAELKLEHLKTQREMQERDIEMRDKELTHANVTVTNIMAGLDAQFDGIELERGSERSPTSECSSQMDADGMCLIFQALNVKARVVVDFSSAGGPQFHWAPDLRESEQSLDYTRFIEQQLSARNIGCVPASHEFVIGKQAGPISNPEILTRRLNERRISFYLTRTRSRMVCKPDVQFRITPPENTVAWNLFGEVKLPSKMVSAKRSHEERAKSESRILKHGASTQAQMSLVISSYNSFTSNADVNLKELDNDGQFCLIDDDMRPFGFLTDLQADSEAYMLMFEQEDGMSHTWLSMIEVSQATLFWILRRLCGVGGDGGSDLDGDQLSKLWERVVARSSPFQGIVGVRPRDSFSLLKNLREWIGWNLAARLPSSPAVFSI